MVINAKMIPGQLLDPLNLLGTQAFCIHEAAKVVEIRKIEDFMLTIFQIVSLGFEGFDNS